MSCCAAPLQCCGDSENRPNDGFYCGCGCLNGVSQMTIALTLVFAGFWFAVAALGDCQFAVIDEGYSPPEVPGFQGNETGLRRGVGFLSFEEPDGSCFFYYEHGTLDKEAIATGYVSDFLGNDWVLGRAAAFITPVVSIWTWVYMWSFTCTAQIKTVRYAVGAILAVVLVVLQGLTLTVITSGWCEENNCELSRSSALSIAALACFFVSGVCFFLSSDYPGEERLRVVDATMARKVTEEEWRDEERPDAKDKDDEQGGEESLEQALPKEEQEQPILKDDNDDDDEIEYDKEPPLLGNYPDEEDESGDEGNIEVFEDPVDDAVEDAIADRVYDDDDDEVDTTAEKERYPNYGDEMDTIAKTESIKNYDEEIAT